MIIPILVFYFLKDFDLIKDKFFKIANKNFGNLNIENSFYEFNEIISRYFRGQLLVVTFLGISYSALLIIVGVDGGLLIGVISGILSFIPYFGFLFGFVSSIVMSYLQFGDFFHPLYIIIGFTVIQFIESNIVTPKFVGESLGLHPTAVIFALMVGGYLLGLGGMIFSLPVAAFLKVYLKRKFA
jgi:predicted PurR-regulated permease PerM